MLMRWPYFGEDPARCPFEQVAQTIWNFVRLFRKEVERDNMTDGKEVKLEDVESKPGKGSMSRPKWWKRLEISLKEIELATENFRVYWKRWIWSCIQRTRQVRKNYPRDNMTDGKEVKLEDVESKPGKGSMSRPKEWKRLEISLKEIEVATENFRVYWKRLNEQFGQGLKEFLTEVHLLSGQKHPNLISLVGYCEKDKEKILVYEYAQRGSLDKFLRRKTTDYTLTWHQRLKICVGAARGLEHLHYHVGEHLSIIHRDIKSANILLDQNWVAKVSDFGLSKLTFDGLDRSTIVSLACGTMSYIEPEYMVTGILKKKSDVYSFGMVLFEVLCGRLCTIKGDDGILLSGPLAKELYERKRLNEIVDPIV
nr:serine-threonine/tyrosine-protein kinase catalytic domain-containing protein [Tanacetum cinerariifolium]